MLSVRGYRPHMARWKHYARGAQTVDALCQDNASPGMTPLQWCQAQAKDPAIHQMTDHIQNQNHQTFENTR